MQPSPTMDQVRAGADPVVWTHVRSAMRRVEVCDSIVFRAGDVGPGWRIAARTLGVASLVWAATGDRRGQALPRPARSPGELERLHV